MGGAWAEHGRSMGGVWAEYGRSMGGAWAEYGRSMGVFRSPPGVDARVGQRRPAWGGIGL